MSVTIWCQSDCANNWHVSGADCTQAQTFICKQAIWCHAALSFPAKVNAGQSITVVLRLPRIGTDFKAWLGINCDLVLRPKAHLCSNTHILLCFSKWPHHECTSVNILLNIQVFVLFTLPYAQSLYYLRAVVYFIMVVLSFCFNVGHIVIQVGRKLIQR